MSLLAYYVLPSAPIYNPEGVLAGSSSQRRCRSLTSLMLPDAGLISYSVVFGTCIILWSLFRTFGRHAATRLPPRSNPLPILGNIRDFPAQGALEGPHWGKHKALYGRSCTRLLFCRNYEFVTSYRTNKFCASIWEDIYHRQRYSDSHRSIGQEVVDLFREAQLNFCWINVRLPLLS